VGNSNLTDDGTTFRVAENAIITGSLVVTGNLTAQQYIVSSSVTYLTESFASGSNVFGNSSDDYHDFTGSVSATGNITSNGVLISTMSSGDEGGEIQLAKPQTNSTISGTAV